MDEWVAEGVVRYLGVSDDVRAEIAAAHCVVLLLIGRYAPYFAGSCRMGRPIITTMRGLPEVVDDGVNGFLCGRDAADLAEKMERMIALSAEERAEMGRRGRRRWNREFDERIVIRKYMEAIAQ